jgi:purine nucleosidase
LNALYVAELCGVDVPVHTGAARPLRREPANATWFHGRDGLGDHGFAPTRRRPASDAGVDALIDMARAAPGCVLVTLGPLTNVALALEHDAEALRRLARVVVMGGAVDVPGNVTPGAEFNIHVDPAAAARVLESGLPVDMVPLDATRQAVLTREALDGALARCPGPLATRLTAFTRHGFRGDDATAGGRMFLHDPLAVAVALDPTLVGWEAVRLAVGPDGETRRVAGPPNCRVALTVDVPRFMRLFLERLCPAS